MNKSTRVLALCCALLVAVLMTAVAAAEVDPERLAKLPQTASYGKNDDADAKYAPRVTTLDNGVQIQKTPLNTTPADGKLVESWNNLYLNADNRGCTACHTIEDALEMMETYHGIIYMGYETEQGLQNCFGCHGFYSTKLRDSIHTIHQRSSAFAAMGGSCESCHYITADGEFQRWDYVKYDVLFGLTDLAADAVETSFSWNDTEITDHSRMFFKSIKSDPSTWLTSEEQVTDEMFDTWTIQFTGDIDNPCEMTLPELIEKYGTVTRTMKYHCVVNGPGQAMVYQAEVTGIPITRIMEDLGVHEDANMFYPIGDDGYCYNIYTDLLVQEDGLLVVGLNGDRIYADQGFPVAFWCNHMTAGNFTKKVCELRFAKTDSASWDFYGDFTDATTGRPFNKPNVAVLNATDGQIFEAGQPIHLEGFADAWNEPIVKLEYTFDHGATWQEFEIGEYDTTHWVYWTLDINNIAAPGSYLMRIRATSEKADGTLRVNDELTSYMFNVQ